MRLYLLIALSVLGLSISLFAHINALLGVNVAPVVIGLVFSLVFIIPPAISTSSSLAKKYPIHNRKVGWRITMRGAPKWTLHVANSMYFYIVLNFVAPIFLSFIPSTASIITKINTMLTFFTSVLIFFYFIALAIFYSAMQIQKNGLICKCPNSIQSSSKAIFCEKCGYPFLDYSG